MSFSSTLKTFLGLSLLLILVVQGVGEVNVSNNEGLRQKIQRLEEELQDVDPLGGTLVLFDSVSLPHEVLATQNRERWACSGWYHEDQQEIAVS